MTTNIVRLLAKEILLDGPEGSSLDRIEQHLKRCCARDQDLERNLCDYAVNEVRDMPGIFVGCWMPANAPDTQRRDDTLDAEPPPPWVKKGVKKPMGRVVCNDDDKTLSMHELKNKYGNRLRLAGSTEQIIRAVAGNVKTLSSSMYIYLFVLTRFREEGCSYADMMQATGSDNSNLLFLAKSTESHGLSFRFRRASTATNWLVATQFLEQCPHLAPDMLQEAQKAAANTGDADGSDGEEDDAVAHDETEVKPDPDEAGLMEMSSQDVARLMRSERAEESDEENGEETYEDVNEDGDEAAMTEGERHGEHASIIDEEKVDAADVKSIGSGGDMTTLRGLLCYPTIEDDDMKAHLLADREQIRRRVLVLLDKSKNKATIRQDFSRRIGVRYPTKVQRKAFHQVIRGMIGESLIRICQLRRPLQNNPDRLEFCYQMLPSGEEYLARSSASEQQKELRRNVEGFRRQIAASSSSIAIEVTLERQVVEAVARSGSTGTTIEELRHLFHGSKDRVRDLNHILLALKYDAKQEVSAQYGDFPVFSALEQNSRTRSARFWIRSQLPQRGFEGDQRFFDAEALHRWPSVSSGESAGNVKQFVSRIDGGGGKRKQSRTKGRKTDEHGNTMRNATNNVASKPKGRPRKHFDEKATRNAEKYQEKKRQAAAREDALGQITAKADTGRPKRRRLSRKTQNEPDEDDEDGVETLRERTPDVSGEDNGNNTSAAAAREDQEVHINHSQGTLSTSQPTNPPSGEVVGGSVLLPTRNPEKKGRLNLTVQMKYDALLAFIAQERIALSTQIDRDYMNYIRRTFAPGKSVAPYEMDRKVRVKILRLLEKEGKIRTTIIPFPADHRKHLTIVSHTSVPQNEAMDLGRKVLEGDVSMRRPLMQSVDGYAVLSQRDVDAPDSFFTSKSLVQFSATTLEELLSDTDNRRQLLQYRPVRNAYMHRISGIASRARFFHETCLKTARKGQFSPYVKGDMVLDLAWWRAEASVQEFFCLVEVSADCADMVWELVNDPKAEHVSMKDIDPRMRRVIDIDDSESSFDASIGPLIQLLDALKLVEKVSDGLSDTHFRFKQRSPLFHCDLENRKFCKTSQDVDLLSSGGFSKFWKTLSDRQVSEVASEELPWSPSLDVLSDHQAWRSQHRYYKPQKAFLGKAVELGLGADTMNDLQMLSRLSFSGATCIEDVQLFFEKYFSQKADLSLPGRSRRNASEFQRASLSKNLGSFGPRTERQMQLVRSKARRARRERKVQFDGLVQNDLILQFPDLTETEKRTLTHSLKNLRDQFANGEVNTSLSTVQQILAVVKGSLAGSSIEESREALLGKNSGQARKKLTNSSPGGSRRKARNEGSRTKGRTEDAELSRLRRGPVEWTFERSELLRDCAVILLARDKYRSPLRVNPKRHWGASLSLFPHASSMSSIFVQFDKLRTAVGEDLYLSKLEDEWTRIWERDRGTTRLPDDDPGSHDFDLQAHVSHLRRCINKKQVESLAFRGTGASLPADISALRCVFDYEAPNEASSLADSKSVFERNTTGESTSDLRASNLSRYAFTIEAQDSSVFDNRDDPTSTSCLHSVARALSKMVLSTPDSAFDTGAAQSFLSRNATKHHVDCAIAELLDSGIGKSERRNDRSGLVRPMEYSNESLEFLRSENLLSVHPHTAAAEARRLYAPLESRRAQRRMTSAPHKSLSADGAETDEQTAASINLISSDLAEIDINLDDLNGIKNKYRMNGKAINDVDLETALEIRASDLYVSDTIDMTDMPKWFNDSNVIDATLDDKEATDSTTIVHLATIDKAQWYERFSIVVDSEGSRLNAKGAIQVQRALDEAGSDGLTQKDFARLCAHPQTFDQSELHQIVQLLTRCRPPLVHWCGTSAPRLVACLHLSPWTAQVDARHNNRVWPYPWLDYHGQFAQRELWRSALRLILYAIVTRPGITLNVLVESCRQGPLERSDICRVLDHFCQHDLVEQVWSRCADHRYSMALLCASNDREVSFFPICQRRG